METRICSVDGCGSRVLAKTLCSKHYSRIRKYGSLVAPPRINDRMCAECGKRRAQYGTPGAGVCQSCYRRARTDAQPFAGKCEHCGNDFTSNRRYSAESRRGRFCSVRCKNAARVVDGRAAQSALKSRYKVQYGLTLEQVAEMRAKGCAICGSLGIEGRWGNLHIDHDHKTGRVRGALCHSCNSGIGYFKEDPVLLRAAVRYLRA